MIIFSYRMFNMLNREIAVDVDLSKLGCGMNFALYLIEMDEDGGKSKSGLSGARYGTGYCDAQPSDNSCSEFDIIEANSLAMVMTTHACEAIGKCDGWGCGFSTYFNGDRNFYGRGNGFQVDTTKPFTALTRFITTDGTDNGDLKEVKRAYYQEGKWFDPPAVSFLRDFNDSTDCKNLFLKYIQKNGFDTLSNGFCQALGGSLAYGGPSGMTSALRKEMVMSISLWGNPEDQQAMAWMDNEPSGPCPTYANSEAVGSIGNIKFGPIGSTM